MGPLGCPLLVFCFVCPLPIMKVQFKGKQEDLFLKSNIFCFLVGHPDMRHTIVKRTNIVINLLFFSFFATS
jgi:hypothetical protein